jgi:hypothetical protein
VQAEFRQFSCSVQGHNSGGIQPILGQYSGEVHPVLEQYSGCIQRQFRQRYSGSVQGVSRQYLASNEVIYRENSERSDSLSGINVHVFLVSIQAVFSYNSGNIQTVY